MAHYLDPKNDLIFKRIFGEHPDLLTSFLHSLLPLEPGRLIESVEYLPTEWVPDNPMKKNSIVDVRCRDNQGRLFIVEMQMYWSPVFSDRLVFNASKAYVRQLDKGSEYDLLQPVYGLGILNDVFDRETEEFYHHYRILNGENSREVLRGLEFVLVELPKFTPERWEDRKMAVLWLRFLREVKDRSRKVSDDLLDNETIHRALDICEEAAFTEAEIDYYERYWDLISTEKSLANSNLREGLAKGEAIGRQKGRAEGKAIGRAEGERIKTVQMVINSHQAGIPHETIALVAGLTTEEVEQIILSGE
jgi:predicted transposase/invertase (TIGR01784 family)